MGIQIYIWILRVQKNIFQPIAAFFFNVKLQAVKKVRPLKVERDPIGAGEYPAIAEPRDLLI